MVVWKNTGIKPKELDQQIEFPAIFHYAWYVFLRLHARRTSSGFGVNPISYSEIKNYIELTQDYLEPYEINAIEKLDDIAMDFFAKEQNEQTKESRSSQTKKTK